jgi:hypothetical protein
MEHDEKQKQQEMPDGSRRELLARLAALCAWLMAAGVTVRAGAPACPVTFGGGWTPGELTLGDAREIVASCCGYGNGHTDEEMLALLWRFRALGDDEARVWLSRFSADLKRYWAEWLAREQEGAL